MPPESVMLKHNLRHLEGVRSCPRRQPTGNRADKKSRSLSHVAALAGPMLSYTSLVICGRGAGFIAQDRLGA